MPATIVLIDDQPDKRFLMKRLITQAFPAHPLVSFAACDQALSAVLAATPKVVVTNGRIGMKDGIEFTAYVNQELNVPVVMVSLRSELERKATAAGAAFVETGDFDAIRKAIGDALARADPCLVAEANVRKD